MRQTNLKNVACADVLFIIGVCKENTHTHAARAFKRSKKKRVHGETHYYKTAVHRTGCHEAKSHRTDDFVSSPSGILVP